MKKFSFYTILSLLLSIIYGLTFISQGQVLCYTLSIWPFLLIVIYVAFKIYDGFRNKDNVSPFTVLFGTVVSFPVYFYDFENRSKDVFPEFLIYLVSCIVLVYVFYVGVKSLVLKAIYLINGRTR